jgi:hypothetical protein
MRCPPPVPTPVPRSATTCDTGCAPCWPSTANSAIHQHGVALPVDTRRLRAAYWRAARGGLAGHHIDPVTDPILHLLDHVRHALEHPRAVRGDGAPSTPVHRTTCST